MLQFSAIGREPPDWDSLRIQPRRGDRRTRVECSFAPLGLGIIGRWVRGLTPPAKGFRPFRAEESAMLISPHRGCWILPKGATSGPAKGILSGRWGLFLTDRIPPGSRLFHRPTQYAHG